MIKRLTATFLMLVYVGLTQVCMAITSFEQIDKKMLLLLLKNFKINVK